MTKEANIGIPLRGGLGNQLFQIAAALQISKGKQILLFSEIANPRKTGGVTDCLFFNLPRQILIDKRHGSRLDRKLLDINLRTGLVANRSFIRAITNSIASFFTSIFGSLKSGKILRIQNGIGIGFCNIKVGSNLTILNGYFQGHQWSFDSRVRSQLQTLTLKSRSVEFQNWVEMALSEKPIVVHIRLGDYRNEKDIGILKLNYYKKALALPQLQSKSKNIWIFSDEPDSLTSYIEAASDFKIRVIRDININTSETLELMRYGVGYVIANSTFSWWGAFLSYSSDAPIIMPKPWFSNMSSPVGISPKELIEIENY